MFTHCSIRFADQRPDVEHDTTKDRGAIVLNYSSGEQGPAARLMLLGDEDGDGRRQILEAYGISNVHIHLMTEQEVRFTGFAALEPDRHNSLPATAHAAAARVNVTLTLGG
jgi:hypothetical protein